MKTTAKFQNDPKLHAVLIPLESFVSIFLRAKSNSEQCGDYICSVHSL